jgi:photosystem II stability/assembly factor-like uncharacterized protein
MAANRTVGLLAIAAQFLVGCANHTITQAPETRGPSIGPAVTRSAALPPSPGVLVDATPTQEPTPNLAARSGDLYNAWLTPSGAIWALYGNVLEISPDFGKTWHRGSMPQPNGEIEAVAFVLDSVHAWSLTVEAGSSEIEHVHLVVNRTSDGGRTWRQAPVPGDFPGAQRSLFFADQLHGYLMESGSGINPGESELLATSDGGAAWAIVAEVPSSKTGGASLGSQILAPNGRTIWAAAEAEAGAIVHPILDVSRDGGKTWATVALPGVIDRWGGTANIPLGPPVFVDPATGFFCLDTFDQAGTSRNLVFGSRDGGLKWTKLATLTRRLVTLDFIDSRDWVSVSQGLPTVLEATSDAGNTWTRLSTSGLEGGGLEQLDMLDAKRGIGVFLVNGNQDMPAVLMLTTDGGRTWTRASSRVAAAS